MNFHHSKFTLRLRVASAEQGRRMINPPVGGYVSLPAEGRFLNVFKFFEHSGIKKF